MSSQIFVSYSRVDESFVRDLAQSRRAADFLAVIGLAVLFYVSPDRLTWLSRGLVVLIAGILLTALK